MKITSYTTYSKPAPYIAVEVEEQGIYEVPLEKFFKYLFKKDGNLEQYYIDNHNTYKELYKDLIDIGIDIKEKLILYIENTLNIPFPQAIYPSVLRYYKGEADIVDIEVIDLYLKYINEVMGEGSTPSEN